MISDSRNEVVRIQGAPAIPGLSFHRPTDDIDFKTLADVIQKSRDADLYEMVETPEDIADMFRHLLNCDPHKDMLLVKVNGTTVGFCLCEWFNRPDGVRTYEHSAYLMPEWRKDGLRRAMLSDNERRLREIAREHPKEYTKTFEVRANSVDNDWKTLLEEEGYRPFRHNLIMVRPDLEDIPDLPIPEGLDLRPVLAEHHRIIFKATAEAFRDEPNFSFEAWSEEVFEYITEWRAFRPELWQVAWAGDEVAGGVLNFIEDEENKKYGRKWGYTMAIFVRRPYRNRGLASALIARSFVILKKEGMEQAALGVDFENPSGALRLYEKMGFRVFQQYTRYRKPLD